MNFADICIFGNKEFKLSRKLIIYTLVSLSLKTKIN